MAAQAPASFTLAARNPARSVRIGGAGAYLPGLWLDDGWHAVVAACCIAVAIGAAASLGLSVRRSDTLAGDVR